MKHTAKKKQIRIVSNPGDLLCALYSGEPVIYNGVIWRTVDCTLTTKRKKLLEIKKQVKASRRELNTLVKKCKQKVRK